MFCPIREGLQIPEAHFVSGTAALAETCKTVVIPDLHRVAAALKVPFDHVDKPAAMVAVFAPGAASASAEMAAPSALARAFHEKLVRRIGSWRSGWLDVAWCGAVTGAMMDLPGGGRRPMAAVLQLGRRVVAASFDAAMAILESGEAVQQMDLQGYKCCFQVLPKDSQDSVLVTGLVAGADLEQHALSTALSRSAYGAARPRASALALARLAKGEAPNVAAAWARLSLEGDKFSVAPPQKEKLNKVRVRQILIRYWTGKGPQPLNPVARRPVTRKLHEAELELLERSWTSCCRRAVGTSHSCARPPQSAVPPCAGARTTATWAGWTGKGGGAGQGQGPDFGRPQVGRAVERAGGGGENRLRP
ncbi:unnamed protein product [Effrenium voratum]|nr:unnamed protein product [Effrenium voratum]